MSHSYDVVIIGSGPNGLAAGIALAEQGLGVKIYEAGRTVGGGTRTRELIQPGFFHDVCSAVHPMAAASPFFNSLPLDKHGLEWIYPEIPMAHPLEDESAVLLHRSLEQTASELGPDRDAWLKLFKPIVSAFDELAPQILAPFNPLPDNPILMARFGLKALRSARSLAQTTFKSERARALLAGLAAHSILPLEKMSSVAIGLVLGAVGHHLGWPIPKGGSQSIADALASYFTSVGGEIETGFKVESLVQLPAAKSIFFDLTPLQILEICKDSLPAGYARKLGQFKYGAGVFKLDMILDGPVPWKDERCMKAGTVHLGGTLDEISASEKTMFSGNHSDKPYVLVAQQSLFDPSRSPDGKHVLWSYCHVPKGSEKDMSSNIEDQIERFAPGFKDRIVGRHKMNTQQMHAYNANYIGGDINGGMQDLTQLFTRPVHLFNPYHIPGTSFYICSSSTPPGGGVHGMCGYHAARLALKREFDIRVFS